MKVKLWGTRGSIPVPGPETVKYGGNTTCVEVTFDDNTFFVIDAGIGIRKLGQSLFERKIHHVNLYNPFALGPYTGIPVFQAGIQFEKFNQHIRLSADIQETSRYPYEPDGI